MSELKVTDGKVCPKCGSTNTHDYWYNPDDHGLMIYHNWRCRDCGWDDSKKPMTNGDKIRAMSDEELASVLPADNCTWCIASSFCENSNCNATQCDQLVLEWLKQEAKDE